MALSEDQKYSIIFALCHTGKVLVPESTHYNSIVVSRLENLSIQIEDRAMALVTAIESAKLSVGEVQKDNVIKIGDITLDPKFSRENKLKELKRLTNELSNLLDISNRCKFGSGGMGCLVL